MTIKSTPELMGEAVLRAREHWRQRRPGETLEMAPPRPKAAAIGCTITISRESGAGGSTVAREVGRLLDWPVYDRELLERIADQARLRTELVESLDEKRSHWLTEIIESLSGAPTMSGAAYARRLAETVLALAAHGRCVIVGRGAPLIVPPNQSLRIRLVASLDDRAERISVQRGISKSEAIEHIRATDAHRDGFVKDYFHHVVGDPHDYDLVINTSRFSVEHSARLVVEALHDRQQESSEC
jgi:cytidylate kinase